MTDFLTPERRLQFRSSIHSLEKWGTRAEVALKRNLVLPPSATNVLYQLSGTTELSQQHACLRELHSKTLQKFRSLLLPLARNSLSHFAEYIDIKEPPAEFHEFLCQYAEALERRDIMRLALSMPPGHAKTKYFSRLFPAWYLGRNPQHQWLQGGHTQTFVETQMGRFVRDLIDDPLYDDVFPHIGIKAGQAAAGEWSLIGKRGTSYVAKGAGQGISGFRSNAACIDDPFATRDQANSPTEREKRWLWLVVDVLRRQLPFSIAMIIATRWHPDDLIGRVEMLNKDARGVPWEIINLNALIETEQEMAEDVLGRDLGEALWPMKVFGPGDALGIQEDEGPMYDRANLMAAKAEMPTFDWLALYKGKPRDLDGNIVKTPWLQRYKTLPRNSGEYREVKRITVSCDPAEKATERSAYTSIGVWIQDMSNKHYLAHVSRKRLEFPELVTELESIGADWHASVILIEDAGAGTQYIQLRGGGVGPIPVIGRPTGNKSKEFRFDAVSPMFEAGEVWLPFQAPWLSDYEAEILAFPNSTYKDQVDMTSQYLEWVRGSRKMGTRRLRGNRYR